MLATITKVILLIRLMNLFSGLRCKFKLCLNDSVLNETLDISRRKSDTMCRMVEWVITSLWVRIISRPD